MTHLEQIIKESTSGLEWHYIINDGRLDHTIKITFLIGRRAIAGQFTCTITNNTLYLSDVYIKPICRGVGHFDRIIHVVESIAKALKLKFISLHVHYNRPTHLFKSYERRGFKRYSEDMPYIDGDIYNIYYPPHTGNMIRLVKHLTY